MFWLAVVLMTVSNAGAALRITWLWLICLAVAAGILAAYLQGQKEAELSSAVELGGRKFPPFVLLWLIPSALMLFTGISNGMAFLLFLGPIFTAIAYGGAWWLNSRDGAGSKYKARFANVAELKQMQTAKISIRGGASDVEATAPGVALGEDKAALYGIAPGLQGQPELGHVLVVGPTRRGKGLNLLTNLLLWRGSAVVTDIKQEQLGSGHRAQVGRVVVLDPTGRGHRYDPIRDLGGDSQALLEAAQVLLKIADDDTPVFAERAASALVAAFRAAELANRPAVPYMAELVSSGLPAFVRTLATVQDRFLQQRLTLFLGKAPGEMTPQDYSGRFLESAWSTMTARLSPLMVDEVLAMLDGSDFRAADLIGGDRPLTVYLSFPERSIGATKNAFDLVVYGLTRGLMIAGDNGTPRKQQVLFMFDEAKKAAVSGLPDLLSTIAGRGVSVVTYVQDVEQMVELYGQSGAASLLSNSQNQLWYTPADLKSAEYLSRRLGRYSYMQKGTNSSTSRSYGGAKMEENALGAIFGTVSTTSGESLTETDRELMTPDELLQMDRERVLVFAGTFPAAKLARLDWRGKTNLEALAKLPPVGLAALHYTPHTITTTPQRQPVHNQPAQPIPTQEAAPAMPDDIN